MSKGRILDDAALQRTVDPGHTAPSNPFLPVPLSK
jgi:hypothetical protein